MGNWHGYFGIENIGMTAAQKDTLIQVLHGLGEANNGRKPHLANHWRVRLDGEAVIFEALFKEDHLTVDQMKAWLGSIFGVDPATIEHETQQSGYGPVVTFSRPAGTERLRMVLFGGVGSDWNDSRLAVLGYLWANIEAWEELT